MVRKNGSSGSGPARERGSSEDMVMLGRLSLLAMVRDFECCRIGPKQCRGDIVGTH